MKKERTWFRRSPGRKRKEQKEPETIAPEALPVLEAANLQGLGNRTEQQDAFGVSPLERYESDGLLAVLCDGMGGMAEGGRITAETVEELLGAFPEMKETDMEPWLRRRSGRVYRQFRGCGGTTLVGVMLKGRMLSFWCAGDSDLLLLREGVLYSLNTRQEFRNELVLRALAGAFPLEEAFRDGQAGALSEYIGKEEVCSDRTRIAFPLQPEDALLLCSDGVSDTLTPVQLGRAMALSPQACCEKIEEDIRKAARPNQDNYTAILLKYHGKGERNR